MKKTLLSALLALATQAILANPAIEPANRLNEAWWKTRWDAKLLLSQEGNYPIVFLGDSITHGWESGGKAAAAKYFDGLRILNVANSGDRTQHTIWIIQQLDWAKINPKAIMLMIGTNNVGSNKPEETYDGIKTILDLLKEKAPQAKVLLLPIFPRGAKPGDGYRIKNNHVNAELPKLVDGQRIFWLNFNAKLLEADDTLPKSIMPDLLHPNGAGYDIWGAAVKDKLIELSK